MSAVGGEALVDDEALPVWPAARLGQALAWIGRSFGRVVSEAPAPHADLLAHTGHGDRELARWIVAAARSLQMDCAAIDARMTAALDALDGPAVMVLARAELLVLTGERRAGEVAVLALDESIAWRSEAAVLRRLGGAGPATATQQRVARFCDELALPASRRSAVAAILDGGKGGAGSLRGWMLAPAETSFWARVRTAGGGALVRRALAGFVLQLVLALASWWLVGRGALDGRLEPGWLWAWASMLASMVACQAAGSWAVGQLAVTLGGLTKERLLEGILALPPEEVRRRGVGQLLGTVLETEALDALARTGAPVAGSALLQLAVGGLVLALGSAPTLPLAALALWVVVLVAMGRRHHRRLLAWADARLALTHDLIESMVGHRTLVSQSVTPARSDDALATYERRAAALDESTARLATLAPRGWLVMGLVGVTPAFVSGRASPNELAISLGGLLLVYWALRKLVDAGPALAAAVLAWKRTRLFFDAARTAGAERPPVMITAVDEAAAEGRGVLVARDVAFRYEGRPDAALRGCAFTIRRGDRVLLTGASGSGKSTLASLLTGLRQPSSGVLMLGGFDHHSLGPERWREHAAGVPQFHENHVLSASMVFNLLLGRGWPPRPDDWREVETVCAALGLDEVLARMPAGLQQMVGDSGWQLSHGERSRLFVARSLLQELDVRVLDESLSSLDPETLEKVLDCVLARTRTLVVVAHT